MHVLLKSLIPYAGRSSEAKQKSNDAGAHWAQEGQVELLTLTAFSTNEINRSNFEISGLAEPDYHGSSVDLGKEENRTVPVSTFGFPEVNVEPPNPTSIPTADPPPPQPTKEDPLQAPPVKEGQVDSVKATSDGEAKIDSQQANDSNEPLSAKVYIGSIIVSIGHYCLELSYCIDL